MNFQQIFLLLWNSDFGISYQLVNEHGEYIMSKFVFVISSLNGIVIPNVFAIIGHMIKIEKFTVNMVYIFFRKLSSMAKISNILYLILSYEIVTFWMHIPEYNFACCNEAISSL